MSSHTVISPAHPADPGNSGTRQALLRPMPGERREMAPLAADGRGADVMARLFPRHESEAPQDAPTVAVAGVRLGHFLIEEQIGRGGMGGVFRAVDERLNRVVALKVLAPAYARDSAAAARFRNEAQAAARLDHENISRVYYIGDDEGVPFIAFEFVRGTNVRDFILQKGALSPAEAVNYTLQIAQALRHTQAAGVVHRDIKPSNIIITPSGHAKLVDLGLARQEQIEPARELTVPGTTLGTFDYIAPEQARDPRCVDVRTDIYSLGCTLYHMLTGEPPFPSGTMIQKVVDHHRDAPPDPAERNPLTPPQLSLIVRRMMASNPDERFATPELLIHDLSQVAASLGLRPTHADNAIWARPMFDPQPGFFENNKGWLVTLAALLLIAVVIPRLPDAWLPTSEGLPAASPAPATVTHSGTSTAPSDPEQDSTAGAALRAPAEPETPPAGGMRSGITGIKLPGSTFLDEPRSAAAFNRPEDLPTVPPTSERPRPSQSAGELSANSIEQDIDQFTSPVPEGRAPPTGNMPETPIVANPFVVMDALTRTEQGFGTLEAACQSAPTDGLIELRFDGRLRSAQPPVRITKRLTIRAQRGLRPVIELQSAPGPGQPDSAQMFQIVGGLLRLQNVELQVTVRSARCALFSLSQSAELKLEGVSIVVSNPDGRQAAVAEFLAAGTDMQAMMPDSMRREQVALDWSDCLIRGECDLLLLESLEPATVRLENVAAAVRGAFARVRGNIVPEGRISDDRKLSLQLRHLTALLDDGLIRVDTGFEFNREFVPIVVECDDSAIVVRPKEPLVEMVGNQEISVLQQRLRMRSSWSVFDVSGPVWEITQPLEGKREVLDFSALNMGNLIENDLLEQPVHWDEIRFPLLTEADFRLRSAAGQSNRNSSTGVQFGDRFPPADPLAASAPRDLDLP